MLDIWLHSGFSYDMQKKVSQKRLRLKKEYQGSESHKSTKLHFNILLLRACHLNQLQHNSRYQIIKHIILTDTACTCSSNSHVKKLTLDVRDS